MDETVRPVRWVGSSLGDLKTFPRAVQRDIGQAIFAAQCGEDYPSIKALKGFKGASVFRDRRAVRHGHVPGCLHRPVWSGDLCAARLQEEGQEGQQDAEKGNRSDQAPLGSGAAGSQRETELMAKKKNVIGVSESSGNVFADLGFPSPDRERLKAQLMLEIYRAIKDRQLTQVEAGEILGIAQPHVSALMNGRSGNYAVGRLFEFLNALGCDVEIAVRPKATKAADAHTSVVVHP